jgi:hypothetical protein
VELIQMKNKWFERKDNSLDKKIRLNRRKFEEFE